MSVSQGSRSPYADHRSTIVEIATSLLERRVPVSGSADPRDYIARIAPGLAHSR